MIKSTPRIMPEKKRKLVDVTIRFLLKRISEVDPRAAKELKAKISHRAGVPVFFRVIPKTTAIKQGWVNTPKGRFLVKTKGMTTTVFDASKKPLMYVITIGEDQFFVKSRKALAVRKKGLATLLHELGHLSRAHKPLPRLEEEMAADAFTIAMLRKLGLEKEARVYVESRPTAKALLRMLEEKRRKEMEKRRIAEEKAKALRAKRFREAKKLLGI